jgi:hypothetical protein
MHTLKNFEFSHIYYGYDFFNKNEDYNLMNNKLFCTFTNINALEDLTNEIIEKYTILYNKVFILRILNKEEYVITYNIELGNISSIPENTIMVHRKKESNTLYTINSLNELIKKLNNGLLDASFKIDWNEYRNSILLTQHNEFVKLNTKVYKILDL